MGSPYVRGCLWIGIKQKVHTFCQVALATPQVTAQRTIACR